MNFIFINSDSFRRDNLDCYRGNNWIETPNIDRFAKESVVFDHAYAGSFPTVPNRRDVLTGRYVFAYSGWEPISSDEVVLPAVLRKAGYTSYMILDTPHIIANAFGFDRGFHGWNWIRGQEGDRWKTDPHEVELPCSVEKLRGGAWTTSQYLRNVSDRRGEEDYFAPMTMRGAMDWLDRNHKLDKFFLYVDTFDPHEPWDPPRKYKDMYCAGYEGEEVIYPLYAPCSFLTDPEMAHIRGLYAGEVTMVDTWVGKLLKKIEDLGLLGNTMVIFTADHGFYFGEHGLIGKFGGLYNEISRIPLMIHVPGIAPGRRVQFVQPCDLMPTILDLAGVEQPDTIQGKSLVDVLKGSRRQTREFAVTSGDLTRPPVSDKPLKLDISNWEHARNIRVSTITTYEWTLMLGAGDFMPELYNVIDDPHQHRNVLADNKDVARKLHAKYIDLLESLGTKEEHIARRRVLPGM